jgi:CxxC-x17-CxxC domain-containing protein
MEGYMKKKKTAVKKTKTSKKIKAVKKSPKKQIKKESAPIDASADQDIVGLLTVLVRKLTSFESKIDQVLGRLSALSAPKPQAQVTAPIPPVVQHKPTRPARQMYEAVCADCGLDCSVPFKPRADIPVYCKGCFSKRRSKGVFKPEIAKPKEEPKPEVKAPKIKAKAKAKTKAKAKASKPATKTKPKKK